MKARLATSIAFALALIGYVQNARADEVPVPIEAEAVRFELDGPAGCVDDADLRGEIALLGGTFRDANLDDRARTFRVELTKDERSGHVKGRVVARDLVFRENARAVEATSCLEAMQSLALVVATALDEAPPKLTLTPAPISTSMVWPAPVKETAGTHVAPAPRLGSGGIVVAGGGGAGVGTAKGVHAYAAALVTGTTRFGAAGAMTMDERVRDTKTNASTGSGLSNRFGGFVGWGAPWNDGVVGLGLEAGIAVTNLRMDSLTTFSQQSSLAPYAAWNLIFQVPIKRLPVRPVASIGMVVEPGPMGTFLFTTEGGLVWQAW